MQEEGKLYALKTKWWVDMNPGAGECDDEGDGGGDTLELGMDNVGGVFLVLGAGLVVAVFVGIIDFLWNIRQISIDESVANSSMSKILYYLYYCNILIYL